MWLGVLVLAQVFGPPAPVGEQDFALCTGKTQITREERIAACYKVTGKEVLDKKSVASAFAMLGRFESAKSNPVGAISNFDQAIARDPDNAEYYGARGFQYHLLGNHDRALAEYEKGLALKPDSADILLLRSYTFKTNEDDGRALADLDRAIALDPKIAAAYSSKADIYLKQGKTAEALAALDQGLKFKPDYAEFFNIRAEVHRKLGDGDAELADLTRLIALQPKLERGLFLRALLYERLGKTDLAIADYDSLLALAPDHKFYGERRAALLQMKVGGAAAPAPSVVEPARDAAEAKKPARGAAPEPECRVYVPGANMTVSVPCGK